MEHPYRTCKLMIGNAIVDSVNDRWKTSDTGRTARKMWPRLSLIKLQRDARTVCVGVITGHCVMGTLERRIGVGHLANDFCRSCRDEEEEETVPHLLGTCPALCQRRKKYLDAYYMDNLKELSRIDTGSLNRFIRSSEWFQN